MSKFNICFVCDFFYPQIGGVEMHIFQLSLSLIKLGHKVIIITHAYDQRSGVRYMTNGLKVYYCPFKPLIDSVILLTLYGSLPLIRNILIRENIHIVHSHTATSTFGNEALLHAKSMGYKTVYTDHSLFGFSDAACFHVNKILKFFLSDLDHAICVSHTSKENLSLRACLHPTIISVIPNAVDPS
jgi:phosphatidylinositol glycan class A protein